LERLDLKEELDLLDHKDHKVKPDHKDHKAHTDHLDQEDLLDQLDHKDQEDPKEFKEPKDQLDLSVKLVTLEPKDHKELLEDPDLLQFFTPSSYLPKDKPSTAQQELASSTEEVSAHLDKTLSPLAHSLTPLPLLKDGN